jgi:hypothetical protein
VKPCALCVNSQIPENISWAAVLPQLEGLYIKRHDTAVQTIQNCIFSGLMGTAAFFMDAGSSADHPDDVLGRGSKFRSGSQ